MPAQPEEIDGREFDEYGDLVGGTVGFKAPEPVKSTPGHHLEADPVQTSQDGEPVAEEPQPVTEQMTPVNQ